MKKAEALMFGTAGVPESAKAEGSVKGIERLKKLGLDAMEIEYVRGTFPEENTTRSIGLAAQEHGIRLTAHGPYYINLNAAEPEKLEASKNRVIKTAYFGSLSGAESITFHAGFFQKNDPDVVYGRISAILGELVESIRDMSVDADVRPELTGKASQFGSLDEILRLSHEIDGVEPCIDWSHLYARSGAYNTEPEFRSVIETVRNSLGEEALKNCHMHVSGIEFTAKGERKHLDLDDSGFNYRELLKVLKEEHVAGFLICESPSLETDALLLKNIYDNI